MCGLSETEVGGAVPAQPGGGQEHVDGGEGGPASRLVGQLARTGDHQVLNTNIRYVVQYVQFMNDFITYVHTV